MSLWRAKREYEANQSLNEVADDTLLAITLLRNQSDDVGVYSTEEIKEYLQNGVHILEEVEQTIENPDQASNYYLALGNHLRISGRKQTSRQFRSEVQKARTVLGDAAENLEWHEELNDVEKLFRRIEKFTSETSTRNADQVREYLAGRAR